MGMLIGLVTGPDARTAAVCDGLRSFDERALGVTGPGSADAGVDIHGTDRNRSRP